jgi:hypothetical protein
MICFGFFVNESSFRYSTSLSLGEGLGGEEKNSRQKGTFFFQHNIWVNLSTIFVTLNYI